MIPVWNFFPKHIVNAKNINEFKNFLFKHDKEKGQKIENFFLILFNQFIKRKILKLKAVWCVSSNDALKTTTDGKNKKSISQKIKKE